MAIAKIKVTQGNINKNTDDIKAKRVKTCPVFLAARAAGLDVQHVGPDRIMLKDGQSIDLPRVAQRFILQADVHMRVQEGVIPFDPLDVDMEPLQPFEFEVSYGG